MRTTRRKATLADAMLGIAGIALAFAAWRGILLMPIWRTMPPSLEGYYFHAMALVALLTPLSLTMLIMALRQPRPPLRRVVSEPAVVVGLAVLFIFTFNTLVVGAVMGLVGSLEIFTGGKVLYYCRMVAEQTGMAIATAWFTNALSGRFRGPVGTMDFAGGLLGLCWILLALLSMIFTEF